jgi:hypothetical protein
MYPIKKKVSPLYKNYKFLLSRGFGEKMEENCWVKQLIILLILLNTTTYIWRKMEKELPSHVGIKTWWVKIVGKKNVRTKIKVSVHLPTLTRTHAQPTSHLTGTAFTSGTAAQICCHRPLGCDLNVMLMRLFFDRVVLYIHALKYV